MIRLLGDSGEWVAFLVFTPLFLILGEIVPRAFTSTARQT